MLTDQSATVVSLFTGAGGLDIGLERAGFSTVFASDIDPDSVATLQAARRQGEFLQAARIVCADVTSLTAESIRGDRPADWHPTLLAGGPPCQPFSSAGSQRGLSDPRGRLFADYIRLAAELQPDFLLFENVRGLVTARTPDGEIGGVLRQIVESIEALGYATRLDLINAADLGAPQRRVRLYLVASRRHRLPNLPAATHHRDDPAVPHSWISLQEALRGLPGPLAHDRVVPSGKRAADIEALVPGTGLRTGGAD